MFRVPTVSGCLVFWVPSVPKPLRVPSVLRVPSDFGVPSVLRVPSGFGVPSVPGCLVFRDA